MPDLDLDLMVQMFGPTSVLSGPTDAPEGVDPAVLAVWSFKMELRTLAAERGLCRADGTALATDDDSDGGGDGGDY